MTDATPLGEARQWLFDQLDPLGVRLYDAVPENPKVPCLAIGAGSPWVVPGATFGKVRVNLAVTILVGNVGGNATAQGQLESLLWKVLGVITPTGPIEAPRSEHIGSGEYYQTDVPIAILVGDD
jgi:hypothetical protein